MPATDPPAAPSPAPPQNDTIVIKYTIELVVSSGGALSRATAPSRAELIRVPPPCLGRDLGALFTSGQGSDCTIVCEDESFKASRHALYKLQACIDGARIPRFKHRFITTRTICHHL